MFFYDVRYWIFMLPALLLAGYAPLKTRRTFAYYSRIPARSGITGAQAAQRRLRQANVQGVRIAATQGFLSDHYGRRGYRVVDAVVLFAARRTAGRPPRLSPPSGCARTRNPGGGEPRRTLS